MTSVLGGQETLPESSDILAGYHRRHRSPRGDREGGGMAATKAEMPGEPSSSRKLEERGSKGGRGSREQIAGGEV